MKPHQPEQLNASASFVEDAHGIRPPDAPVGELNIEYSCSPRGIICRTPRARA